MSVITEMHPYETPEVIVVPVLGGSEKYVQWVESETASAVTE
jgi:periplasmic divalent cation tolerance protein